MSDDLYLEDRSTWAVSSRFIDWFLSAVAEELRQHDEEFGSWLAEFAKGPNGCVTLDLLVFRQPYRRLLKKVMATVATRLAKIDERGELKLLQLATMLAETQPGEPMHRLSAWTEPMDSAPDDLFVLGAPPRDSLIPELRAKYYG